MELNIDKIRELESNWKTYWKEKNTYSVKEDPNKEKFYVLDMFPYPSGAGLHVGHPLGYVASDIFSRYKRMSGYNVLHPMGYDAFGLPAEQYAVETGTHPEITTEKAIARYKEQLDKIGFNYDWSRSVKTSDPNYYKWTQWIFQQLFSSWYNRANDKAEPIETLVKWFEKNGTIGLLNFDEEKNTAFTAEQWQGFSEHERYEILMEYRLAYQAFTEVNWCEALGTVLANDEVKDGKSERGGYPVEKRKMRQWSLRITEYSERLLQGLEKLDWSESIKEIQRNWIGKSEGALVEWKVESQKSKVENITVFTTRPDTIFGATFVVLAPEHELVATLTTAEQKSEVEQYIAYVKSRSDIERQQEKKVTGVFTGSYVKHPFSGEQVPIWLSEYVLAGYGTGAIMAVPSDDERDKKFAEKFGLPIVEVIDRTGVENAEIGDKNGVLQNSDFLNGLPVKEAIRKAIDELENRKIGKRKINYKQRDAGYSRQRYWGEPFPIKYKQLKAGNTEVELLPLDELPLKLPQVTSFKPTGDGRSPLANNTDWVTQGYETDTMPGFAGSSWYFLRYMDAKNEEEFASQKSLDYWKNVDVYFGGAEHAVGHLLYSRFWYKFLHDLGYVKTDEPFQKMVNQGMIQGVSKFVYRLSGTDIFVSRGLVYDITYNPKKVFSYLIEELKKIEGYEILTSEDGRVELIDTTAGLTRTSIAIAHSTNNNVSIYLVPTELHVDVSFVENDVLNEEKFKAWRNNFSNAKFIREEDKYLCGSQVEKMSKSKYNVINPDDVIEKYGADCFRMFEMFLGPIEQSKPWDDKGISGVYNFLRKYWRLFYDEQNGWKVVDAEANEKELKVLHKTIKKVTEDIEKMSFNTSVSAFMIAVNELQDLNCHKRAILEPLVLLLAPFAPFITEELWQNGLKKSGSVHHADFPKFEEKYLVESSIDYPISINGKTRANIVLSADATQEQAQEEALKLELVQKWLEGKPLKKFVFVKGRIINIVV